MSTGIRTATAREPVPDHEQKRVALGYLQEAWAEARLDGLDVPSAGVARALALRPRALLGDAGARAELATIVDRLTAPGLGSGVLDD